MGLEIPLPPFDVPQVAQLASKYEIRLDRRLVEHIATYTGGDPYLAHLLLYSWWKQPGSRGSIFDGASAGGGVFNNHLRRYCVLFDRHEELRTAMRAVLVGEAVEDQRVVDRLMATGLVRADSRGRLVPASTLYEEYFRSLWAMA